MKTGRLGSFRLAGEALSNTSRHHAMSRENGDGARQLLFIHLFLDQAVQTFEALA